jgi:hypothetical protein
MCAAEVAFFDAGEELPWFDSGAVVKALQRIR